MARFINSEGWMHEDSEDGESHNSPENALMHYIMYERGSEDDDNMTDRSLDSLNNTVHSIFLYKEKELLSEDHRDEEMIGLDDEEWLIDLPIGGKFFKCIKIKKFKINVVFSVFDNGGNVKITFGEVI